MECTALEKQASNKNVKINKKNIILLSKDTFILEWPTVIKDHHLFFLGSLPDYVIAALIFSREKNCCRFRRVVFGVSMNIPLFNCKKFDKKCTSLKQRSLFIYFIYLHLAVYFLDNAKSTLL